MRGCLPWTRLLEEAEAPRLADWDALVLKRSHDYGGKSVVIGRNLKEDELRKGVQSCAV